LPQIAPNRGVNADCISDRLTVVVLHIHFAGDFLGFDACEELIGAVARPTATLKSSWLAPRRTYRTFATSFGPER
jgi:hypothetical protein